MRNLIIAFFILLGPIPALSHELALTFDDLPGQGEPSMQVNQAILDALKEYKAPAIGFVNEGSVTNPEMLKLWVTNGFPLGNHTFSHLSLNRTPLEEYEKDVIKGSVISKQLMENHGLNYTYFRHPYLHTGTTPAVRAQFEGFLEKEGYLIAPATIDTDDWVFNNKLSESPKDKDEIIRAYLEHTRAKFAFYEQASNQIFGRNIKHIWLLHVNPLNAYCMKDLLKIAQEFGYEFVTLDRVLTDSAYASEDNYYEDFGIAWLYRWDYTRGKVVDWSKEPEPSL